MPTFDDYVHEIRKAGAAADRVRRQALLDLHKLTGRPTIFYGSCYTHKGVQSDESLSIESRDVHGFMSAIHGLPKDQPLDLILHSPGGLAEVTEQIVNYLRDRFTELRVIVPQSAMSAATMLACAADVIVMGRHSALGPIDPQLVSEGGLVVGAESIIREFEMAEDMLSKGGSAELWARHIDKIPPGMLWECHRSLALSSQLVEQWLRRYMFKGSQDDVPGEIAKWLGNPNEFLTHGRPIFRDELRGKGLKVENLEDDQAFQEAVLGVFHSTMLTFQTTPCVKLIENHQGRGHYVVNRSSR